MSWASSVSRASGLLPGALLAVISIAGCSGDNIVYRDRLPFNEPPAAAAGVELHPVARREQDRRGVRGVCTAGCVVRPADDDACRADGGTCIEGGFYCGGDKVEGDPQTRYTCAGGVGVDGVECADACVVAPPGEDDYCR